jgi:NADH-quinone oxidoreductase subunit G
MPKCTINGKELEVKDGTTIIQAMQEAGMHIAHYCYHPGLSVAGVCRICMVEIEGLPRVQIACNTAITEGMKINNTSAKVKEAVRWGLDFHLINHPLDCPICDQAGECGLQDQYMEYGKYDPEMAERKVKKHKVVDLGPTVMLDSERCILCSRCVRFTTEVSKTNELGIFNRGDHSEIGTADGVQLNNKYSLNTVDICPVGALTSKDFRFRQRVWYLKDSESICNGCSTGCNIRTYFNKEGFFRVKPIYNKDVNGYWMCDEGRNLYKFVNRDRRYLKASQKSVSGLSSVMPGAAAKELSKTVKSAGDGLAVILTGQYSSEEYDRVIGIFVNDLKTKKIYHWMNNPQEANSFDGLLLRGDKNPNTKGLLQAFEKYSIKTNWSDLEAGLSNGTIKTVIVAGPENLDSYSDVEQKVKLLSSVQNVIWLQSAKSSALEKLPNNSWIVPMKSYLEKDGTFINYSGRAQKFKKVTTIVSESLTLAEAVELMAGQHIMIKPDTNVLVEAHRQQDIVMVETRKKNEFVFKRGPL